ncbi:hypothetical protein QA641_35525 [Bradyrhizobium sp. CB1650]|uniref:hypothetical protein n=1 Tax=Bradyrhizobium sp. CB1650 TaxID=3039153 RepID=UPI00243572EE|nr:hypothetical protein [Bradyrhizobium sp. CB1650]WGD50848.1 hypothetical protein QA641_35525 [Bradyrhizobium sp. CB1650]
MTEGKDKFLEEVESYEDWYDTASGRWYGLLNFCKFLTLAAALASVVVSVAMDKEVFGGSGRWILVGIAIITAAANEVLGQLKVREMEDLRERGRIEAARIGIYARQRLAELGGDPAALSKVKDEIRGLLHRLELSQHGGAVLIDSPDKTLP